LNSPSEFNGAGLRGKEESRGEKEWKARKAGKGIVRSKK
jgi:hypothetical protein